MNFLQTIQDNANRKKNTKGGIYHDSTLSHNLDLFSFSGRYYDESKMVQLVNAAYGEDKKLFFLNVINILDIRTGKGERKQFKSILKELVNLDTEMTEEVLRLIPEYGRWDYMFEILGLDQYLDSIIERLVAKGLESSDLLMAKWLPSENASSKETKDRAKKLIKLLDMTPKVYRKTLSMLRNQLNLVETNLTEKQYGSIDYSKVPTKAMLKYRKAFSEKDNEKYQEFLGKVEKGEAKINTTGLFPYEIISKIGDIKTDVKLLDAMWKNQKNFLPKDFDKNVLVMADTSASMTGYGQNSPIHSSIGLAMYFAERNKGVYKDQFLTFSNRPKFVKLVGEGVVNRRKSFTPIHENTNIDAAMKLILDSYVKSDKEQVPEYLMIISDMEFDQATSSGWGGNFDNPGLTNLETWKKDFKEAGIEIPQIIFWNASQETRGFPAVSNEQGVSMISGFSPSVLSNLFDLEKMHPINTMIEVLRKYEKLLK